jgi:hypothetical protein
MRCLAVILILTSSLGLGATAAHAARRPTCSRDIVAHTKRQETAQALTRRRYTQALARKKLAPITLEWKLDDERGDRARHPIGETFVEDDVTYVAGHDVEIYRPGNALHLDFARDAAGDIWLVDHVDAKYSFRSVTLCGCPSTGGGAPSPTTQLRYRVPEGATFRGRVEVRHDVYQYSIGYNGRAADGSACGPPP